MCSPLYKVAILKEIVVGWVLRCPVTAVVKSWLVPTSCGDSDLCKRSVFIRYRCLFLLCASCSARHRGLDVFVTTPRYEHTCHLLSRYLQCHGVRYAPSHFFPAVTLDAGGKGGVCVCCTIHHRSQKKPLRQTPASLGVLIVIYRSQSQLCLCLSPQQHSGHYRDHLTPIIHFTTVTTSRWGNWTEGAPSAFGKESDAFPWLNLSFCAYSHRHLKNA